MNNKASIDLMSLVGAQVQSAVINGKTVNAIVIPVAWNDISVTQDTNGNPNHAYLNLREWQTNDKFRQACEANHQGEEDYVAPSHTIAVSYREEFEKAAIASAVKRLKGDATFMAKNPTEDDIQAQARIDVRNRQRIGYVTPLKRTEPAAYAGTAPAMQGAGAYIPTTEAQPGDDLPF